jgi:hypothetical protein
MRQDPIAFLSPHTSTPAGDAITGKTNDISWRLEPRQSGFTTWWIVKTGYLVSHVLTLKAAERARDDFLAQLATTNTLV